MRMKAGVYYVGDPCYVIKDTHWMHWLNSSGLMEKGSRETNEHTEYWAHNTAHGDGRYDGFAVDSGLIGAVNANSDLVDAEKLMEVVHESGLGEMLRFREDFDCLYHDGQFQIGDRYIETDWKPEPDDGYYVD